MTHPTGDVLHQYLHDSFHVIQYVHDNMGTLRAIASHLTPVEDLVEFQTQVTALYAELTVLAQASHLVIGATQHGLNLLNAVDIAQQRMFLGLKTAALREASYFAKAEDFTALSNSVSDLHEVVQSIIDELPNLATAVQLEALRTELEERIAEIETGIGNGSYIENLQQLIQQIQVQITTLTTRVDNVEDAIEELDGRVVNHATAIGTLTLTVETNGDNISAHAQSLIELNTAVSNHDQTLEAQGSAVQELYTRTEIVEGHVVSQSGAITQLEAQVVDVDQRITATSSAVDSLTTRVEATEDGVTTLTNATTQLGDRVTDTEAGLLLQAAATDELSTRITATEDTLEVQAESITSLRASITSVGNQIPNAGFEHNLRGWQLFMQGTGWLSGTISRNLEPTRLPPGVGVLGITTTGVPAGEAGVRCANIPLEGQKDYILSGYLAAENCELRMEWRLLDVDGEIIEYGTVGAVENASPTTNLSGWTRVHAEVSAPIDGAQLQVQLWVGECNTTAPKAWFLRPQLEPKIGDQDQPSPWSPSSVGIEDLLATAVQSLDVRVTANEDGLESLAEAVTDLGASVGSLTQWQVNTHVGSGDPESVSAPLPATLRKVGGAPVYTFLRGLTLVRFSLDGEFDSAVRYDTFSSSTERDNLAAALNALTDSDPFILVSRDHHGIKKTELNDAMLGVGALSFPNVVGSRCYILMGRGLLGAGNGVEIFAREENLWIEHKFLLINDTPMGLLDNSGLAMTVAGQATAIDTLTTRVTTTEDGIEVLAERTTTLEGQMVIAENGIIANANATSDLTIRVTAAEGLITSIAEDVTDLEVRITDTEGDVEAVASGLSSLIVRVSDTEDGLEAVGDAVTALDLRIDDAETDIAATSTALDTLTTRVTTAEGEIETQASAITALDVRLDGVDESLDTQGTAISELDVRVTATEDSIESIATDVTLLETNIGDIGGENLLWNASFEQDQNTNNTADGWLIDWTGASPAVATLVPSSLPSSIKAQQVTIDMSNADSVDLRTDMDNDFSPQALGGRKHVFSIYTRGTVGAGVSLHIEWHDDTHGTLTTSDSIMMVHTAAYQRLFIIAQAPADATRAVPILRTYGATGSVATTFVEADNAQFQLGSQMTNYSLGNTVEAQVNAAAMQALTTRVTATEEENTAQSSSITDLTAGTGSGTSNPNVLLNPSVEVDLLGWFDAGSTGGVGPVRSGPDINGTYLYNGPTGVGLQHNTAFDYTAAAPSIDYTLSADVFRASTVGTVRIQLVFYNSSNVIVGSSNVLHGVASLTYASQWRRVYCTAAAPATTSYVRVLLISAGTNGNDFFRRMKLERGSAPSPYNTDGYVGATGRAFSTLSTTVSTQGSTITSQGTAITGLTSSIAGKADVSAVSALTTRVSDVEAGGYGANLLSNATFATDINGWTHQQVSSPSWLAPVRNFLGTSWHPPGINSYGSQNTTGSAFSSSNYINVSSPSYPTGGAGVAFIASAYLGAIRCHTRIWLAWLNSAGTAISYTAGGIYDGGSGGNGGDELSDFSRQVVTGTSPAGCAYVQVLIQILGNGNINPHFWIVRPMLERKRTTQTLPSEWNSGGLETFASWNLTLDVAGNVTGLSLWSNGATSAFKVRSDLFEMVPSSGTGARIEMSGGNFRAYDSAGTLRVRLGVW